MGFSRSLRTEEHPAVLFHPSQQNLIQGRIRPSIPSKTVHASDFPQNALQGRRSTLQMEMAYCHRDFGA